MTLSIAKSI